MCSPRVVWHVTHTLEVNTGLRVEAGTLTMDFIFGYRIFEMDCINAQPGSTNGDKPKWDVIETTLSTMYGILLVSIYAAFQYTELVKFPSFYHWLEINGFFIYLYVISIIYFLYLLIFVLRGTNKNRNSDGPIKVVENEEVG